VGYVVQAGLFTAAEVGAPHKRQRLFALAYRAHDQWGTGKRQQEAGTRTNEVGRQRSSSGGDRSESHVVADSQAWRTRHTGTRPSSPDNRETVANSDDSGR